MIQETTGQIIEATDLSPISSLTDKDELWLRKLVKTVNASTLSLRISSETDNDEPIAYFDEQTSQWWAGRYIGEVQYEGRTLRILPRFGMPQLHRWLSRIWGVRFLGTKGQHERSHIWLWDLIARLWETRLLAAAKHGLPTIRVNEIHCGQSIRGRLQVRPTSKELSLGRQKLVSKTRNRQIDNKIGGIIVSAFNHLRNELRYRGDERTWLTQRGQNLITQLRAHIPRRESIGATDSHFQIRYTPITETYRPLIDLSLAIIRQRPFSSKPEGEKDVLGVLIDMAEIWELYVYNLLRSALSGVEVIHAGRNTKADDYLLKSQSGDKRIGGLKPDILIFENHSRRPLAILDAKYKTTTKSKQRPHGVLREDLYQIASYLTAFGQQTYPLNGALIYPTVPELSNVVNLQKDNPWLLPGTNRQVFFYGINYSEDASSGLELTQGEKLFITEVRSGMLGYNV